MSELEFGSFFVGGRTIDLSGRPVQRVPQTDTVVLESDPNGTYRIEQAYVQWFRPPGGGPKVVLQHGGGLCGSVWEATPDGRPGWAQDLVGRGFETYVVDNVERGRAGWCPFPEVWDGGALMRSAQETWSLFRIGRPEDYAARRPFAGQLFPVERFDDVLPFNVPRWPRATDIAVAALVEVVRRVGPCSIVGHSQGGEIVLRAVERVPSLVESVVLLEPSGSVAGGFGPAFDGLRVLVLLGDFLDRHPVFRALEPATLGWVEALDAVGAEAELRRLPGNSHLMMMDRNSAAIAGAVADWLGAGAVERSAI